MDSIIIFCAKYLYFFNVAGLAIYFFTQPRYRQKSLVILATVFLPVTYVFAKASSFLYFDPRPFATDGVVPLIPHVADNGFPSDHMLFASAIAAILFVYNKKWGTAAFIIAGIVGIARVFVGVHHWIDIAGSLIIVTITMWITQKYTMKYFENIRRDKNNQL